MIFSDIDIPNSFLFQLRQVDLFVETLFSSDIAFHNTAKCIADLKKKKLASTYSLKVPSSTRQCSIKPSKQLLVSEVKNLSIAHYSSQQVAEQVGFVFNFTFNLFFHSKYCIYRKFIFLA